MTTATKTTSELQAIDVEIGRRLDGDGQFSKKVREASQSYPHVRSLMKERREIRDELQRRIEGCMCREEE